MTISFDPTSNRWKSRYSYDTSCFDSIDNVMLTFNTVTNGDDVCYSHDQNSNKNTFYGEQTDSQIQMSFNANPSTNKLYKSLSLEGAYLLNAESQFRTNYSPDPQQDNETQVWEGFDEKGGIFYGGITKVASSSNENSLKMVGEITGANAIRVNPAEEPNINNGQFPFYGVEITDEWWNYVFLNLAPGPHFLALDSASAEETISKYFVGIQNGNDISVRPFRVNFNASLVGQLVSPSLPAGQILDHDLQSFNNLFTSLYNTNYQAKIPGNIIAARIADGTVTNNSGSDNIENIAVATAINEWIENNPNRRIFLYKVTDDRIDGSDPMGQYADITLNLGSQDFELFAVNAQYSATALDHSN